jgi:hypothetical protein
MGGYSWISEEPGCAAVEWRDRFLWEERTREKRARNEKYPMGYVYIFSCWFPYSSIFPSLLVFF